MDVFIARCSLASSGISTERPPLLVVKMIAFTAAMSRKSGLRSSCRHAGTRLPNSRDYIADYIKDVPARYLLGLHLLHLARR